MELVQLVKVLLIKSGPLAPVPRPVSQILVLYANFCQNLVQYGAVPWIPKIRPLHMAGGTSAASPLIWPRPPDLLVDNRKNLCYNIKKDACKPRALENLKNFCYNIITK